MDVDTEADMNEQGIAWIIAGSTHDLSPEERRQRALRRELALSRPHRASIRERFATAVSSRIAAAATTTQPQCCAA
jgi:hypothetical protein